MKMFPQCLSPRSFGRNPPIRSICKRCKTTSFSHQLTFWLKLTTFKRPIISPKKKQHENLLRFNLLNKTVQPSSPGTLGPPKISPKTTQFRFPPINRADTGFPRMPDRQLSSKILTINRCPCCLTRERAECLELLLPPP